MSGAFRWIRSGPTPPAMNMALDEALLRSPTLTPTLRTYLWEPWTLSLGYFQAMPRDLARGFTEAGYGLVRRPTGGRAIFHGDELTYAVVCPLDTPGVPRDAVGAYHVLHGAIARALSDLGVDATLRGDRTLRSDTGAPDEPMCFYRSTEFDLVAGGRKLVGSAQRRTGRAILQHGSIPAGPNHATPEAACVGARPSAIEDALVKALAESLGVALVTGEPTRDEMRLAEDLAISRYASDAWTWRR